MVQGSSIIVKDRNFSWVNTTFEDKIGTHIWNVFNSKETIWGNWWDMGHKNLLDIQTELILVE